MACRGPAEVALYKTNPREMAEKDFGRLAGAGRTFIDPADPIKELARLEAVAERIRTCANKRIAHFDTSNFTNLPTCAERPPGRAGASGGPAGSGAPGR